MHKRRESGPEAGDRVVGVPDAITMLRTETLILFIHAFKDHHSHSIGRSFQIVGVPSVLKASTVVSQEVLCSNLPADLGLSVQFVFPCLHESPKQYR